MGWWRRIAYPVRRAWLAVCSRVKARKNGFTGGAFLKLHNDVQTCGYQDVQVMWEMLKRAEKGVVVTNVSSKRKRSIWRLPIWSNKGAPKALRGYQHNHN